MRRARSSTNPDPQNNGETSAVNEARDPRPALTGPDQAGEAATEVAMPNSAPDPFDPARFRLSQNFDEQLGVRKLITTIPVRKPPKEAFIRTHPDEDYRFPAKVIELKEERELYLVESPLWEELATESTFVSKLLVSAVTRQGLLFLWPIRLPGTDGKLDEWNRSALEAADHARTRWIRVTSNHHLGAYEIHEATSIRLEPEFPQTPMKQLLQIAFKGRMISGLDHPVLRTLRGEV